MLDRSIWVGQLGLRLSDHGDGETKMTWGVRHTSAEDRPKQLDMGFELGFATAAKHLNDLAKSEARPEQSRS